MPGQGQVLLPPGHPQRPENAVPPPLPLRLQLQGTAQEQRGDQADANAAGSNGQHGLEKALDAGHIVLPEIYHGHAVLSGQLGDGLVGREELGVEVGEELDRLKSIRHPRHIGAQRTALWHLLQHPRHKGRRDQNRIQGLGTERKAEVLALAIVEIERLQSAHHHGHLPGIRVKVRPVHQHAALGHVGLFGIEADLHGAGDGVARRRGHIPCLHNGAFDGERTVRVLWAIDHFCRRGRAVPLRIDHQHRLFPAVVSLQIHVLKERRALLGDPLRRVDHKHLGALCLQGIAGKHRIQPCGTQLACYPRNLQEQVALLRRNHRRRLPRGKERRFIRVGTV